MKNSDMSSFEKKQEGETRAEESGEKETRLSPGDDGEPGEVMISVFIRLGYF